MELVQDGHGRRSPGRRSPDGQGDGTRSARRASRRACSPTPSIGTVRGTTRRRTRPWRHTSRCPSRSAAGRPGTRFRSVQTITWWPRAARRAAVSRATRSLPPKVSGYQSSVASTILMRRPARLGRRAPPAAAGPSRPCAPPRCDRGRCAAAPRPRRVGQRGPHRVHELLPAGGQRGPLGAGQLGQPGGDHRGRRRPGTRRPLSGRPRRCSGWPGRAPGRRRLRPGTGQVGVGPAAQRGTLAGERARRARARRRQRPWTAHQHHAEPRLGLGQRAEQPRVDLELVERAHEEAARPGMRARSAGTGAPVPALAKWS